MSIEIITLFIISALICEFIDSYLGMMYGTILSPVLIIAGFNPLVVVPCILFSQGVGGFFGPLALSRFKSRRKLIIVLGLLTLGLGSWTLLKTWAL